LTNLLPKVKVVVFFFIETRRVSRLDSGEIYLWLLLCRIIGGTIGMPQPARGPQFLGTRNWREWKT